MIQPTWPLEPEQRQALLDLLAQHLSSLDDRALLRLAEAVREPAAPPGATAETIEQLVSRRRFMLALLGSGLLATSASAIASWQWGVGREAALDQQRQAVQDRLAQVWGLLALHEQLDQVPLESAALDGLASVGTALDGLAGAVGLVRDGVRAVRETLQRFETSLPKIRTNLAWLETALEDVSREVHLLGDALGHALNQFGPIADGLALFFDALLAALPPSLSQQAREVLDRVRGLVAGLPALVDNISLNILILLREEWFSDEKDKGLHSWLIEPLQERLLNPIEALLDCIAELGSSWEQSLARPVRGAIQQRAVLRQQIADYKTQHNLQNPTT